MKTISVLGISLYQALLSCKQSILVSVFGYHIVCKHRPSCSQYTINQIKNNGTISGLSQGLWRIVRCW